MFIWSLIYLALDLAIYLFYLLIQSVFFLIMYPPIDVSYCAVVKEMSMYQWGKSERSNMGILEIVLVIPRYDPNFFSTNMLICFR